MPTAIDNVMSAIKTIAESVPGIGLVYDQLPLVNSEDKAKKLLVPKGTSTINVLSFFPRTRAIDKAEGFVIEEVGREIVFIHQYAYNFEKNSQKILNNFIEALTDTFNQNQTLNNTIAEHTKMELIDTQLGMYGTVLVHISALRMTVYKSQSNIAT